MNEDTTPMGAGRKQIHTGLEPLEIDVRKSELLANQAPKSQHYKGFAIEPLQYIEANALPFIEGNIIKYVSRWRHKDGLDDLRKAEFYIKRLIEQAEQEAKNG